MNRRFRAFPQDRITIFRRLHTFSLAAMGSLLLALTAGATDEGCKSCSVPVEVTGEFEHYKNTADPAVTGMASGDSEAAFREEVYGPNFSITVSHLPAGKYTVVIGEAELFCTVAGQRVFNVSVGNQLIATNYDIFAVAGGSRKAVYFTAEVEHKDDSLGGPLTVKFTPSVEKAKFNTFEIKNAAGETIIKTKASDLADSTETMSNQPPVVDGPVIWKDATQPLDARVADLISRMSLTEKVPQMRNSAPAIPRLGLPSFDYWNEALHGVGRAGIATVFPQAIGMAATWDTPLVHAEADVISTEGRAKFNDCISTHNGNSLQYYGLTYWSPNINIFRDPRWGRGQETYGEDTFLTGTMGVAFIHGIQGDDTNYLKAVACAKHFAVHSGPESTRHRFDAEPSERDFYETYLPHFEMAVREGHVGGFMGSYNAVYGKPACASPLLLTDLLRNQWGFDGYVVSDCGAINDIRSNHKFTATAEEAAAAAVKAGCDLCCGGEYNALLRAVQKGLITEKEMDAALAYVLKTRFRLGLFDPADKVPYSKIPISENDSPEHTALALKAAQESIVLLKNEGVLPLNLAKIKRLLVIGTNASSVTLLLGNYNGTPSHPVTILAGIQAAAGAGTEVVYEPGCPLVVKQADLEKVQAESFAHLISSAKSADAVIYVGGINAQLEGEEGDARTDEGFHAGDRTRIELPVIQQQLIQALQATGKPLVFVDCSGSAIAMPWAAEHVPAIVQAWYPGEQGGNAVADVLFGKVNPSGRLPVTFYSATSDLPAFEDYSMSNRTYRFFSGKPLFAFGHGLSYTKFTYQLARLDRSSFTADQTIHLRFVLRNTGKHEGAEVAQVYFRHLDSAVSQPKLALCNFSRVELKLGEATEVKAEIPAQSFRYWDTTKKQYVVEPGKYELLIGAASDDIRLRMPLKITAPQ